MRAPAEDGRFESDRLTVDEFFDWHQTVEGRYELVDGRIVPHPDFVTPRGLAAPSNDHAAILSNLDAAFRAQLAPPCRVYNGAGIPVGRTDANVPDLAVSCDPDDRMRRTLANPRFVCEVLSTSTRRTDTARKVGDYLALASLEAYVVVDPEHRSVTVYRPGAGPQTYGDPARIRVAADVELDVAALLA